MDLTVVGVSTNDVQHSRHDRGEMATHCPTGDGPANASDENA